MPLFTSSWERTLLGFCKRGEQWQLAINEQVIEFDAMGDELTGDDYATLLSAPRTTRIAAIEHFDELLDKLKTEATRTLAGVTKAKKLAALERNGGK